MFSPLASALNLLIIPDLVSEPSIIGSSTALSWPHKTEFVDSYFKFAAFVFLSFRLSCDHVDLCRFLEDIPFAILQRLADIDCRKSLIAHRMWWELSDSSDDLVFDISATPQTLSHTIFECIRTESLDKLDPAEFLLVWFEYDYPHCIYSHMARLSINWRKQISSDHMFLSLDRAVPQPFFTLSPARSR